MSQILGGSTDRSEYFYLVQDDGGTNPGEPATGLTATNITSLSQVRTGAGRVDGTAGAGVSDLGTVNAAHSDGGMIEVDATNTPGLYRFDFADAAYAAFGAGWGEVTLFVQVAGAANAIARPLKHEIVAYNPAQSLNLTASGNIGIDWANVENPTTAVDLSATDIQLADTVTTLTGHTPQTGDTYADWADGGRLDLLLDAILADTGADGVVLASATLDAIATALLDLAAGVEAGVTFRQYMRITLAALAGKADGLATTTVHYRNQADTLNRITATVDADGNRSAITLDVT